MTDGGHAVRDFVKQIDTTLRTRRLYAENTKTFRESNDRLFELLGRALVNGSIKLRLTGNEIFCGKDSVLFCEERSESFFFPLFRDGLRELVFNEDVARRDLEGLLRVLEADKSGHLSPTTDTVSLLWRADLASIAFTAIDGIGDDEGGEGDVVEGGGDDYRYLISEVMRDIQNPATAETGQSYAFVLDADFKVTAADMHYDATTQRLSSDERAKILHLSPDERAALRAEIEELSEGELLSRFVDILFVLLNDPAHPVSLIALEPIFDRLLNGYWTTLDHDALVAVLRRLYSARREAPHPENRDAAQSILSNFLTLEAIEMSFERVITKTLPLKPAFTLWVIAGSGVFPRIVGFWSNLQVEDLKEPIQTFLRKRLSANPDRLRPCLDHEDPAVIRGALALLTPRAEPLFEEELLALTQHDDEKIRLKGLAAAGRLKTQEASKAIWRCLAKDPSKAVRLLAFRLMESRDDRATSRRIQNLVTNPAFHSRPVWEREKYVRLLASIHPEAAVNIFKTWIPENRWILNQGDRERAKLAFEGLMSASDEGRRLVQETASTIGRTGKIAQEVVQNWRETQIAESQES